MNGRFLLLLFFLLPASVFAGTGYYLDHRPNDVYETAQAACDTTLAEAQALQKPGFNVTEVYAGSGYCAYTVVIESTGQVHTGQGVPCSSTSPTCLLRQFSCAAGYELPLTWPLGRKDSSAEYNIAPGTEIPPPSMGCTDRCEVARTSGNKGCFNFDGEGAITYCDYNAKTTGNVCSAGDYPEPEVPEIPPPDPCQTNPQASGCPGSTDPGDGGTDPGDGGTDPGDGGTDPGDGGTDPGGGGTNPGGGGTDPGDGGGGDGGDGDGNGSAGGYANCDVPTACDGDAIACAQLELQKYDYCTGLEMADFPGQKDQIDDFLDQPALKPEEDEEINLGDMFSEGTRFLPSSCPQAKQVSLTLMGGRSFSFSYEPLCQFASDLSYLIVAAAAVFYALYVGRAVGGE